jgi:hypothetical protein
MPRPRTSIAFAAALLACAYAALPGSAAAQGVSLVPFGGQNYSSPFHVASPPGDPNRVMVVQGGGVIRLVKDGVTQPAPFLDISADVCFSGPEPCGGESGLFSIAFAPDYSSSGRFYAFYTRDEPSAGNNHYLRIEEFRRSAGNPDTADIATRRLVLEIPHFTASNHNGGSSTSGSATAATPRTSRRTPTACWGRSSGSTQAEPPRGSTRSRATTPSPQAPALTRSTRSASATRIAAALTARPVI